MSGYDVIGMGNAIVDAISHTSDGLLAERGIEKGIMQLVEQDRAEQLYATMHDPVRAPGGSVANTIAGLGALGATTGFIGRVCDDELGRFYAGAMTASGTDFLNPPATAILPTSRCMIFVSPDGERSMNTYLGISAELSKVDVDPEPIGRAKLLFLEGYLYDKPGGKEAFEYAAGLCKKAGGQAGISLSDPFCVDRHRDDFQRLIGELDFVIGNVHEWQEVYQCDLSEALDRAAAQTGVVICTQSGEDVILRRGAQTVRAEVTPVTPVDATGAGDQFAAGFLFGMMQEKPLEICGRMGCIAAAEVIGHIGPRPQEDVRALFAREGLL